MLYNSTYYRTIDLESIIHAVYETLDTLAPEGREMMSGDNDSWNWDYYANGSTAKLRYLMPNDFVVGMDQSNQPRCWRGSKSEMACKTMFIALPHKHCAYAHDLQQLSMPGLFPNVKGLVRGILCVSLRSQSKSQQKAWEGRMEAIGCKIQEAHLFDRMAEYVISRHPNLELHIDEKANKDELRACRRQRALLRLEEARERLQGRTRRLKWAEQLLTYRNEQVASSQAQVAKLETAVAKFEQSNA